MTAAHVLFLGYPDCPLIEWLQDRGDHVAHTMERLDGRRARSFNADFLVSYRYRHILKADVLDQFPDRAVNLHASLLPWNRGADPNLWSFLDDTPKGVTLHYIDEGIDTGDIIAQREIVFDAPTETLASTYRRLDTAIQHLFRDHWDAIKSGRCPRRPQPPGGSVHRLKDRDAVNHLLYRGWDTPVEALRRGGGSDRSPVGDG